MVEQHIEELHIQKQKEKQDKSMIQAHYMNELKIQQNQQLQKQKKEAEDKARGDKGLNIYESDQFKAKMAKIATKKMPGVQAPVEEMPSLPEAANQGGQNPEKPESPIKYINVASKKDLSKRIEEENKRIDEEKKRKMIQERMHDAKWLNEAREGAAKEVIV